MIGGYSEEFLHSRAEEIVLAMMKKSTIFDADAEQRTPKFDRDGECDAQPEEHIRLHRADDLAVSMQWNVVVRNNRLGSSICQIAAIL